MKKLDRELGLFSVFSISCGAMLGPGLFVLPGLAYTIGGPAAILGYTLAGLLVIPAALSQAEMATALPQSGGPYLFLDRSLGPLAGTISGLGTWISLILKTAFSLIGLGAYLLFMVKAPGSWTVPVAVIIALSLITLNSLGGKIAGQVQSVLVIVTMFVLTGFVGRGSIEVQRSFYHPFFREGMLGLVSVTAFVFVSYAGIAKVVSVAEEIKNPSRNIPWGISLSLVVTVLLYSLVVYVIVGVVPAADLGHGSRKIMPLVQAGQQIGGEWGMNIMAMIAVLALGSMANAGLMAASRFPLPLARDGILPSVLSRIHPKFSTPLISILLTGTVLVLCILFLPVKNIAKLASAFLLLVFALVNLAVIVFRESEIEWYQPDFQSPLYPFVQITGFLICITLIFFMGWFPFGGASGLIAGCLIWYYCYARSRVDRLGAFWKTPVTEKEIETFEQARTRSRTKKESVILPFIGLKEVDLHAERRIRIAASLCARGERLDVVHFVEVPEQSFLRDFETDSKIMDALSERIQLLRNEIDNEIHLDEVVTHSSRGAIRNYARQENPHWVVFDWKEPSPWQMLLGRKQQWWLNNFPTDMLFFDDHGQVEFQDVLAITDPGPFDGEIVYAADHIAGYNDGTVTFLNPLPEDDRERQFLQEYQQELQNMCDTRSNSKTIPTGQWVDQVVEQTRGADLLVIGGLTEERYPDFRSQELGQQIVDQSECSVAKVQSTLRRPRTVFSKDEQQKESDGYRETFTSLDEDQISADVEAGNKDELFHQIARQMKVGSISVDTIRADLWQRENVQSTYVGSELALPHAIIEGYPETKIFILVLEKPVSYTEQGDHVQVCVATVAPPSDRGRQLELIGEISTLFLDHDLQDMIVNVRDPEAIIEELQNVL